MLKLANLNTGSRDYNYGEERYQFLPVEFVGVSNAYILAYFRVFL
jgi:hypothetical protein